MFEPFYTTKPVGKGSGQGLAIAHAVIVEKHRGRIEVESSVGQGTSFILHLPLNTSEQGEGIP
jgi:signal transduction histidine kinase